MHLGSSGPVGAELWAFAGMVAPIAATPTRAIAIAIRIITLRITAYSRTEVCREYAKRVFETSKIIVAKAI